MHMQILPTLFIITVVQIIGIILSVEENHPQYVWLFVGMFILEGIIILLISLYNKKKKNVIEEKPDEELFDKYGITEKLKDIAAKKMFPELITSNLQMGNLIIRQRNKRYTVHLEDQLITELSTDDSKDLAIKLSNYELATGANGKDLVFLVPKQKTVSEKFRWESMVLLVTAIKITDFEWDIHLEEA